MDDLTLHQFHLSGNCYKIRLTAAILGIKLKLREVDFFGGEQRTPEFLSKINAYGKIPVLQIGQDKFLPESNAACYYLASGSRLIPTDRLEHAQMLQWMFWEQYQHEPALAVLRFWLRWTGEKNLSLSQQAMLPDKRKACEDVLGIMNDHLAKHTYFVGDRLTLADVALSGYTPSAADAGFDLADWPHVAAWCQRISKEPGFVPIE